VVIVILVTLVAGVIPMLSPNNDKRKIREAARGLQAYINATQAEAARTGRPHGIGFAESPSGDGMALEVFRMEVPLAFAGFSDASRVVVKQVITPPMRPTRYGPNGNKGTQFALQYNGYQLYELQFIQTGGAIPSPDQLPPHMFRIGDRIDVNGNQFLIIDKDKNKPTIPPNQLETFPPDTPGAVQFLKHPTDLNKSQFVQCVWINATGQQLTAGPKPYRIIRQPVTSSAAPFVFPAGIGIDLQGSVQEGGPLTGLPVPDSFATNRPLPDSVIIMFSPGGSVSSVMHNGNQLLSVARIVLLLGRVENGDLAFEMNSSNVVTSGDWTMSASDSNEQLAQKQAKINWLNPDSRLLGIAARSGRAVVSPVAFVDARLFGADPPATQAVEQIEAAHNITHPMKRGGGR